MIKLYKVSDFFFFLTTVFGQAVGVKCSIMEEEVREERNREEEK